MADINRRIAHLQAGIEGLAAAVGTYATASTESTSYVGMELRRLDTTQRELDANVHNLHAGVQAVDANVHNLDASALEERYKRRLLDARDLPLSRLEGEAALLLNHASSHKGFAAQANLWFNDPLRLEHVPGGVRLTVVNERIVELPFALACLARVSPPGRILDIGSAESTFPLSAASLGYQVTAVDPRPIAYEHPNLQIVTERFEDWEAEPGSFAAVVLISTVEHVGLPADGGAPCGERQPGAGADRAMIDRIKPLLADDGHLVLTTPYGSPSVDRFQRVYDDGSLAKLLKGWEVLERRVVARRGDLVWVADTDPAPTRPGVVMIAATPTRS